MKIHQVSLFLAFAFFTAVSATAAPLVSGNYRLKVPLSPALLNGRYPVFVNEGLANAEATEGRLDVTTSPTGKISGKVEIFGQFADVTGQMKIRQGGVQLKLRGKTSNGTRVRVKTTLEGNAFTGTVKLGKFSGPARIDIDGIAPTALDYVLALTVDAKGKVTGFGTLMSDVGEVPVTVRGKTKEESAELTIKGGKTMFAGKGPTNANGFTAKWKAQGFGALLKGEELPAVLDAP